MGLVHVRGIDEPNAPRKHPGDNGVDINARINTVDAFGLHRRQRQYTIARVGPIEPLVARKDKSLGQGISPCIDRSGDVALFPDDDVVNKFPVLRVDKPRIIIFLQDPHHALRRADDDVVAKRRTVGPNKRYTGLNPRTGASLV
jgi:hypothetical protein